MASIVNDVAGGSNGQKAPSAKRCIKTCEGILLLLGPVLVRKHRAPKGALRQNYGDEVGL